MTKIEASAWANIDAIASMSNTDDIVQIQRFSPVSLAYIGDAVYELYVRHYFLSPPKRIEQYHREVVAQVRAESQANHLQVLLPHLNEKERDMVRRGRNAANSKPRRLSISIYQQASSLETLIGYLYLIDRDRLQDLLTKLDFSGNR
ncbi:MAG: ribonuclease III domain-containing protein [Xenococcaceae cyanobacterium MO_167.B52]|nr:ribonuclease III domain-containing protein [Xenococcaceae cyanobacterium MO_167.B52]